MTDRALQEALWGQYALFIAVRIQDDLFDRQADARSLILVPNLFLTESARCYGSLCEGRPAFWSLYSECTASTVRAILNTEILQKAGECPIESLLEKYAEVGSIFKVGAGALCMLADRFDQFSRVSRFCDEMAKVSQIYDDIEDVINDLSDGRMNYVARRIGLSVEDRLAAPHLLEKIEGWLRNEAETMGLVSEIREHIACAEEAIAPLELPGAAAYCRGECQTVDVVKRTLLSSPANALRQEVFRPGGISCLLARPRQPGWSA